MMNDGTSIFLCKCISPASQVIVPYPLAEISPRQGTDWLLFVYALHFLRRCLLIVPMSFIKDPPNLSLFAWLQPGRSLFPFFPFLSCPATYFILSFDDGQGINRCFLFILLRVSQTDSLEERKRCVTCSFDEFTHPICTRRHQHRDDFEILKRVATRSELVKPERISPLNLNKCSLNWYLKLFSTDELAPVSCVGPNEATAAEKKWRLMVRCHYSLMAVMWTCGLVDMRQTSLPNSYDFVNGFKNSN